MRRIHIPDSVEHRYQIYKPRGRHKSFRVARIESDGSQSTIKDRRIAVVNEQLASNTLSLDQATVQIELIIEDLYRKDGVKVSRVESNKENEAIVEKYVKTVVSRKKSTDDSKRSAEAALYRDRTNRFVYFAKWPSTRVYVSANSWPLSQSI